MPAWEVNRGSLLSCGPPVKLVVKPDEVTLRRKVRSLDAKRFLVECDNVSVDPKKNFARGPEPKSGSGSFILQAAGTLLMIAGWTCGIAGIVVASLREDGSIWAVVFLIFFTFLFTLTGRYCYKLGRQKETTTLNQDLATHSRNQEDGSPTDDRLSFVHFVPYTLYLRAFGIEEQTNVVNIFAAKPLAVLSFVTPEEAVAQALRGIAPGVAIGRPGDKYPPRGMRRLYAKDDSDEEWQKLVIEGMQHANLVVIRAPDTESSAQGLWWEIEQAGKLVKPERLLIMLPFASDDSDRHFANAPAYNAFRKGLEKYLPCSLPDYYGTRTIQGGSLTGLLHFSANWDPYIVSLDSVTVPPFRKRTNLLGPIMKIALKPVYEQLGVRWSPPPFNEWIIIALSIILAPMVLMLVMETLIRVFRK